MQFNSEGIFLNDLRTYGKLQTNADAVDAGEIYIGLDCAGVNGDNSVGFRSNSGAIQVKNKAGNWSNLSGTNTGDQDLSGLLKLDQTSPQTVINGRPTFSQGLKLGTSPTVGSFEAGKIFYDATNKTISAMIDGDITMQVGQEELLLVYNNTESIIPNGSMVYHTGVIGETPTVGLADASHDIIGSYIDIGMTTQAIGINQTGFVTVRGIVHDVDTSLFTAGQTVYLSATVPGGVSPTPPIDTDNYLVKVGIALVINSTTGSFYINQVYNNRLVDLTDVSITSPVVDQVLKYNGQKWINGHSSAVSAGVGVSFFLDKTPRVPAGSGPQSNPLLSLARYPIPTDEVITSIEINNTTQVLTRHLSTIPLEGDKIEAGVWTFNTYGYVSNSSNESYILTTVRKSVLGVGSVTITGSGTSRTATVTGGAPFESLDVNTDITMDGLLRTPNAIFRIVGFTDASTVTVETLSTYTNEADVNYYVHKFLFTDSNTEVNNLAVGLITTKSSQPAFNINPTDTLACTYYARTNGNNKLLYLYYNGTTHYSHMETPLAIRHNDLSGLQGGLNNERYHLSAAQAVVVSNTSGTNTGDQTLAGLNGVEANTAITPGTGTKITYDAKGLVTAGSSATTADILAVTDKKYVTDAQLVVIGNTSGTNTGDISLATNSGLVLTNKVLNMGTPTALNGSTTNSVTTNTHTHAVTLTKGDVGLGYVDNTSDADKPVSTAQQAALDEPHIDIQMYGFLNQTETSFLFEDAVGTTPNVGKFTLVSTGPTFSYYRAGIKHTITGNKSVYLPDATANTIVYFIYFNGTDGTITASTNTWNLYDDGRVPICTIARNSSLTPTYVLGEERHTVLINRRDHMIEHFTQGAIFKSGGTITGLLVDNNTDAAKSPGVLPVEWFDEDILETSNEIVDNNGTGTPYTICYPVSASEWAWKRSNMPFKYSGAAAIEFNNALTMTAATNGNGSSTRYVNYFMAVTSLQGQESIVFVPGLHQHSTSNDAYAEVFSDISLAGFPAKDGVTIYQFTWKTNVTSGTGLCVLDRLPVRIESNTLNNLISTSTVHNILTGIQGGTTNEYYHLSSADVTKLNNITGTNTGDQNLSGYEQTINKGAISGYASLDVNQRVVQEGKYHNHQAGIEGLPTITDGTGGDIGKVKIAAAFAWMYTDAEQDRLLLHTIPESSFLTLNSNGVSYICADRDTDAWVVISEANVGLIDNLRYIPYIKIIKRTYSNGLHKQIIILHAHGEVEKMHDRTYKTARYAQEEGSLTNLSVTNTTNVISLAGGVVWVVNYPYDILAVTAATGQYESCYTGTDWFYFRHSAPVLYTTYYNAGVETVYNSGYSLVVGRTYQILARTTLDFTTAGSDNNTVGTVFHCTSSQTLGTSDSVSNTEIEHTTDYWGIDYVWRGIENEDHLYTCKDDHEYTSMELAQAAKKMSLTPPLATGHAMFVGRIIYKKGATTSTGWLCESAFDTVFQASTSITDHGSLTGLADNDHPQYLMGNLAITGATNTKITYDSKGLVTAGAAATTADIADSSNKRYVTDANLTIIGNTSGTNTGDNSANSLYSGLVSNAVHTGDVTGGTSTTVVTVGTSSAANIHAAELLANAATNLNTNSAIVKRDASGNFVAGTITATLTGNASSATYASAGTITNDATTGTPVYLTWVTANTGNLPIKTTSTRLSFVPSTGILTASGFSGPLTGNVTGNVSGSAGSFTGSLVGDVTGTQGATVVSTVGTSSAANVHAAELLANAATNLNTASAIVKRDANGYVICQNVVETITSTATAAGTTTLTSGSTKYQNFTGTSTQILVLPNATTLTNATSFFIVNSSTGGSITVNMNGGTLLGTVTAGADAQVTLISNGTAAGTWNMVNHFPIYNNEAYSAATYTVTNPDAVVTGMTLTPPAGLYKVFFEAPADGGSATGTACNLSIYSGGVQVTNSIRAFLVRSNSRYAVSTSAIVTVNGAQAIDVRANDGGSATTVSIYNRRLEIIRIG